MTCLRIPLSLEDADAVVVACSGVLDWRPLFVLGLQSAALAVILAAVLVAIAWRLIR